jgi:hypothetical protein
MSEPDAAYKRKWTLENNPLPSVNVLLADVESRLREGNPVEAYIALQKAREFVHEAANARRKELSLK